jgi:hypothetical protein
MKLDTPHFSFLFSAALQMMTMSKVRERSRRHQYKHAGDDLVGAFMAAVQDVWAALELR